MYRRQDVGESPKRRIFAVTWTLLAVADFREFIYCVVGRTVLLVPRRRGSLSARKGGSLIQVHVCPAAIDIPLPWWGFVLGPAPLWLAWSAFRMLRDGPAEMGCAFPIVLLIGLCLGGAGAFLVYVFWGALIICAFQ